MGQIKHKTVSINPMTGEQRRHIYFLLNHLNLTKEVGDEMCFEWTEGRAMKISELQFIDALSIIKYLKGLTQNAREPKVQSTTTMPQD